MEVPLRCVVTGGCGFIGSHLVDSLVDLGHEVTVLDDLSTSNGEHINSAATLIEGSVMDTDLVTSATKSADWIFHNAAWARVPRSVDDPIGTHNVNVNGTLNVLQAARANRVSGVINSSSSSVYGDQPTHIMQEDMIPKPKSPLRTSEAHWRAVCRRVRAPLQPADHLTEVLQRLRPQTAGRGSLCAGHSPLFCGCETQAGR